jgi:hypothetical protein
MINDLKLWVCFFCLLCVWSFKPRGVCFGLVVGIVYLQISLVSESRSRSIFECRRFFNCQNLNPQRTLFGIIDKIFLTKKHSYLFQSINYTQIINIYKKNHKKNTRKYLTDKIRNDNLAVWSLPSEFPPSILHTKALIMMRLFDMIVQHMLPLKLGATNLAPKLPLTGMRHQMRTQILFALEWLLAEWTQESAFVRVHHAMVLHGALRFEELVAEVTVEVLLGGF